MIYSGPVRLLGTTRQPLLLNPAGGLFCDVDILSFLAHHEFHILHNFPKNLTAAPPRYQYTKKIYTGGDFVGATGQTQLLRPDYVEQAV